MLYDALLSIFETPSAKNPSLIFIGMSGTGKSHWSRLLSQEFNIPLVSIDEEIGKDPRFIELIENIPGDSNVDKLGRYFGMPWEDQFPEKEQAFLEVEEKTMARYANKRGHIIDTGGSAIYSAAPLAEMKENGIIVYLENSLSGPQLSLEDFKARPRPVCWKNMYQPEPKETHEDTYNRCYDELLKSRVEKYLEFADIILPEEQHRDAQNAKELAQKIIEKGIR